MDTPSREGRRILTVEPPAAIGILRPAASRKAGAGVLAQVCVDAQLEPALLDVRCGLRQRAGGELGAVRHQAAVGRAVGLVAPCVRREASEQGSSDSEALRRTAVVDLEDVVAGVDEAELDEVVGRVLDVLLRHPAAERAPACDEGTRRRQGG